MQDGKLQAALEGFQKVLSMQGETKGEWGFKALKQMVKALFRQGQHAEMMKRYQELLNYLHVVTKNQSEKVKSSAAHSFTKKLKALFAWSGYD